MKKLESVEREYIATEGFKIDPVTEDFCSLAHNITAYVVNEGIKSLINQEFLNWQFDPRWINS